MLPPDRTYFYPRCKEPDILLIENVRAGDRVKSAGPTDFTVVCLANEQFDGLSSFFAISTQSLLNSNLSLDVPSIKYIPLGGQWENCEWPDHPTGGFIEGYWP